MQPITLGEAYEFAEEKHPGCHVVAFEATKDNLPIIDVLVWQTEAESEGDDGQRAIARYNLPREVPQCWCHRAEKCPGFDKPLRPWSEQPHGT